MFGHCSHVVAKIQNASLKSPAFNHMLIFCRPSVGSILCPLCDIVFISQFMAAILWPDWRSDFQYTIQTWERCSRAITGAEDMRLELESCWICFDGLLFGLIHVLFQRRLLCCTNHEFCTHSALVSLLSASVQIAYLHDTNLLLLLRLFVYYWCSQSSLLLKPFSYINCVGVMCMRGDCLVPSSKWKSVKLLMIQRSTSLSPGYIYGK